MGKSKRALKGVMEYKEYKDKLSPEEQTWVKQFYDEYHGGNHSQYDDPILTTTEQIKEANRNYNSLYKDGFNVSKMLNSQTEITAEEREVYELASDEIDWETAVMQQGYEAGIDLIMEQAIRDLEANQDKKVVLSRFYVKMNKLYKLRNTEKRKQR